MIVADASAVVELLLNTPAGQTVGARLLDPEDAVAAPELLDLEALQVLRRYLRDGDLTPERCGMARHVLTALPIERYPHGPLLDRAWQLRDNLTIYDAVYVALAEALEAPLLTRDARLAQAPHAARIELV